jgi:hypothetical protein
MKNNRILGPHPRRCDFCGSGVKQRASVCEYVNRKVSICSECVLVALKMLRREGLVPDPEITFVDPPPKDE